VEVDDDKAVVRKNKKKKKKKIKGATRSSDDANEVFRPIASI